MQDRLLSPSFTCRPAVALVDDVTLGHATLGHATCPSASSTGPRDGYTQRGRGEARKELGSRRLNDITTAVPLSPDGAQGGTARSRATALSSASKGAPS